MLPFLPLRINRCVRFGFSGSTVLVGSRGDQVSFNTTDGVAGAFESSLGSLEVVL